MLNKVIQSQDFFQTLYKIDWDLALQAKKNHPCGNCGGNLRVMMGIANNLLGEGVSRELEKLDEKLFFEVFNPSGRK